MNLKSIEYYQSNQYFQGKNVLITGATGGIGSFLLKTLYYLGAKIVCIVRNEAKFRTMFNDLLSIPNNRLDFVKADFEKCECIEEFKEVMIKLGGKLDIMFCCHGRFDQSELMDTTLREYDIALNTNTRSLMTLFSLATPFLKLTKGNIVAISSLESYIPVEYSFLNTVTKSMVNMLIECSALELASFGVRVNGVAPGVTNTKFRVNKDMSEEENNTYLEKKGSYNLLNNEVIQPSDIVETMLFLASDDAGFVTGEIIVVDNGFSLNHDLSFYKQPDYLQYI